MEMKTKVVGYFIVIVLLISSSLIVLGAGPVSAEQDGDYTYSVSNGYATITGYTGVGGAITIPDTMGGLTSATTAIGNSAFSNTNITSVIIPGSVASIGNNAFDNCVNLTSITFLEQVAPTVGTGWLNNVPAPVGHAYGGVTETGLTMGSVITQAAPGAPTNLKAVTASGRITLSWNAPADGGAAIDYYRINPYLGLDYSTTSTSAVISGLANGQSYTFTVMAHNSLGLGVASLVTATPGGVPDVPTNVAGTPGNKLVNLSWTAPASNGPAIDHYVIYLNGTTALANTATTTSTVVSNLVNGVSYTFTVAAINSVGNGNKSLASQPIIPRTVPSAPSVTATAGAGNIALSWTAPANGGSVITGYNVYRSATQNGVYTLLTTNPIQTLSYTDSAGLTNGTTYYYEVRANNAAGQSANGTASSAPGNVPAAPAVPTLTAGNNQISLSWTAPASTGTITGYTVYRSTTGTAGSYGRIASTSATTLQYVNTGLVSTQTYWYQVSANNSFGEGAKSAAASSTPFSAPNAPTGLRANTGNANVVLNWTAAFNGGKAIDYYIIYQNNVDVSHPSASQLTATITGLTNGQSYVFTVAAHNSVGNGTRSASVTAVPSVSLLVTITYPVANTYVNTSNVNVQWIVGSAPAGVKYNVSVDGATPLTITSGALSQVLNGLTEGAHTVTVRAYDNTGKTNTSTVRFTIDSIKPKLNLVSPAASSLSNVSTQTVVWTASDAGSGIAYYWVNVDGGAWSNVTVPSKQFIGLSSAQHTVDVRAYDHAGNYNETAWIFVVDTTLPTITFLTPAQGSSLSAHSTNVTWKADDASGISAYMINVDGSGWMSWTTTMRSITSLNEGTHIVSVRAQDKAGNWNQRSLTFVIDTTNPTVLAFSPTGGEAQMNAAQVATIAVSFSEKMNASSMKILVNGKAGNVSTTDGVNFTCLVSLSYDQGCTVNMTAKDLAGNPVGSSWSFTTIKNEGYIEGVLHDANGNPVFNATITLSNGMTTLTDANGHFKFSNVTSGKYLLKITKDGYPSIVQDVTTTAGQVNDLGSIKFQALGTTLDPLVLIAAFVLLITAILVMVVVVRRRSSSRLSGGTAVRKKRGPMTFRDNVRQRPPKDMPKAKDPVVAPAVNVPAQPQGNTVPTAQTAPMPRENYNRPPVRTDVARQVAMNVPANEPMPKPATAPAAKVEPVKEQIIIPEKFELVRKDLYYNPVKAEAPREAVRDIPANEPLAKPAMAPAAKLEPVKENIILPEAKHEPMPKPAMAPSAKVEPVKEQIIIPEARTGPPAKESYYKAPVEAPKESIAPVSVPAPIARESYRPLAPVQTPTKEYIAPPAKPEAPRESDYKPPVHLQTLPREESAGPAPKKGFHLFAKKEEPVFRENAPEFRNEPAPKENFKTSSVAEKAPSKYVRPPANKNEPASGSGFHLFGKKNEPEVKKDVKAPAKKAGPEFKKDFQVSKKDTEVKRKDERKSTIKPSAKNRKR